ncbi:MAG: tail fiber protein [Ignavibacteria bacterium]|jgi:microcystin-dependent protein
MNKNGPKILSDSSSPEERRGFLKKLAAFAAGVATLGGFTNLRAKNTFSGRELSTVASPDAYIGSITMFGGNFAIRDWGFCAGQTLAVSDNSALFSILGCTFGGDCRSTFGYPDLRGRVPISSGQGPGLPYFTLGTRFGATTHTLSLLEMPVHNHTAEITVPPSYTGSVKPNAKTGLGGVTDNPTDAVPRQLNNTNIYSTATPNATMAESPVTITPTTDMGTVTVGNAGGSQAFSLMQPTTVVNFIICEYGVYPPRN